jgi:hypothetical protein
MSHLRRGDEKSDKDKLSKKKWEKQKGENGTVENITFSWACNAITEAQILQLTPYVHS